MKEFSLNLNYWELLNLHKALQEAKFHENPDNELIAGSPLIADVYRQVKALLLQSSKADDWNAFFQLETRPDLKQRVIAHMQKDGRWNRATDTEKRKIAEDYTAPFVCREEELLEIITAVDCYFKMRTAKVIVLPYDENWKAAFEAIKVELEPALLNLALGIEHVGSTAVAGMFAKPCIDIDVIIPGYEVFDDVVRALNAIGYVHKGDLGIPEREAFAYSGKSHLMKHHLYVCPRNSAELHRHLTFRDFLRGNPEAIREYSSVKETAAALFPDDIDRYMAFKSPCIEELYRQCGLK